MDGADGLIDFRLARERTIMAYKTGEATRSEVCDAQRELMRNAHECGMPVQALCPICGKQNLVEVLYCLLYTSPSPRDGATSRMPSSA